MNDIDALINLHTPDGRDMWLRVSAIESVFEGKPMWRLQESPKPLTREEFKAAGYDPDRYRSFGKYSQINMRSGDKGECVETVDQIMALIKRMSNFGKPRYGAVDVDELPSAADILDGKWSAPPPDDPVLFC